MKPLVKKQIEKNQKLIDELREKRVNAHSSEIFFLTDIIIALEYNNTTLNNL